MISFIDLRTRFRQMGRANVPDLKIAAGLPTKIAEVQGMCLSKNLSALTGIKVRGTNGGRSGGVRLGGTGGAAGNGAMVQAANTVMGGDGSSSKDDSRSGEGTDGVDASEVKRMRESITMDGVRVSLKTSSRRAHAAHNGNQELMVRAGIF